MVRTALWLLVLVGAAQALESGLVHQSGLTLRQKLHHQQRVAEKAQNAAAESEEYDGQEKPVQRLSKLINQITELLHAKLGGAGAAASLKVLESLNVNSANSEGASSQQKQNFHYDCNAHPDSCPSKWGSLYLGKDDAGEDKVNVCASTERQSPINLPFYDEVQEHNNINLKLLYEGFDLQGATVLNNGHTVEVKIPESTDAHLLITKHGKTVRYNLKQFHFHHPSEHTVGGRPVAFEMHLVHAKADPKVKHGEDIVMMGLLFVLGPRNPFLKQIFSNIPGPPAAGQAENLATVATPHPIDLERLLHHTHLGHFWNYKGSLTNPPCSEVVEWFVLSDPLTIGLEQLQAFEANLPGGHNARPVGKDLPVTTH